MIPISRVVWGLKEDEGFFWGSFGLYCHTNAFGLLNFYDLRLLSNYPSRVIYVCPFPSTTFSEMTKNVDEHTIQSLPRCVCRGLISGVIVLQCRFRRATPQRSTTALCSGCELFRHMVDLSSTQTKVSLYFFQRYVNPPNASSESISYTNTHGRNRGNRGFFHTYPQDLRISGGPIERLNLIVHLRLRTACHVRRDLKRPICASANFSRNRTPSTRT